MNKENTNSLMVLPRHLAIVMDGNGRWARKRGLPRVEGHRKGAKVVQTITRACRRLGIEALTLYAFSQQNWNRPPEEVQALMELLGEYIIEERAEILENGIRLSAIGDLAKLPSWVREPLGKLMEESSQNNDMELCLALSYGGREEILRAVKLIAEKVCNGEVQTKDISQDMIEENLWTSHLPPLDFVIRTSGERRLSNFLLWQAAFAEYYFTDTLWPDFEEEELMKALHCYGARERRYGLTSEQIRESGVSGVD